MANNIVKCRYKHCEHLSRELPRDEAVKIGNSYMHKDCAETSKLISEIKDYYYQNISNTVVMKTLVAVINNIVFTKSVRADYVLFALKYAHNNQFTVRSPYGIYYLIDNSKIKNEWTKHLEQKMQSEALKATPSEEPHPVNQNHSFKFSSGNHSGFNSIFGN